MSSEDALLRSLRFAGVDVVPAERCFAGAGVARSEVADEKLLVVRICAVGCR